MIFAVEAFRPHVSAVICVSCILPAFVTAGVCNPSVRTTQVFRAMSDTASVNHKVLQQSCQERAHPTRGADAAGSSEGQINVLSRRKAQYSQENTSRLFCVVSCRVICFT